MGRACFRCCGQASAAFCCLNRSSSSSSSNGMRPWVVTSFGGAMQHHPDQWTSIWQPEGLTYGFSSPHVLLRAGALTCVSDPCRGYGNQLSWPSVHMHVCGMRPVHARRLLNNHVLLSRVGCRLKVIPISLDLLVLSVTGYKSDQFLKSIPRIHQGCQPGELGATQGACQSGLE